MLEEKAAEVERRLSKVLLPGFDVDVITAGFVTRFRISRDGKKVAVYIDYSLSNPRCGFRRVINSAMVEKVADEIKEALKGSFEEVYVLDDASGRVVRSC
ncbi:MAG: hypothetical protein N3F67_05050 [Acidilobaceae archaeon]|nr:hypothetical protein [Acidilobaceae archaeon]